MPTTWVQSWLCIVRASAKKRGIYWEITVQDIYDVWYKQRGKCALTGLPISFGNKLSDKSKSTASLDRIDSSRGYVFGNIQFVHKHVNTMKNNFSEEYFIKFCRAVSRNKRRSRNIA